MLKRFITYLYECKQGKRIKNVGFIRIDIRGDVVNIEICLKNGVRVDKVGNIYGLVHKNDCIGINLGEVVMKNGEECNRFSFNKNHIADSSYSIKDLIGFAIRFGDTAYFASCWKDEWAEEIGNGAFYVFQKEEVNIKVETVEEMVMPIVEELPLQTNQMQENENEKALSTIAYKKINIAQIRELPSANWHLNNNSFLRHGVFNYGFLFLKREIRGEMETLWLGVPGYFEKPEMIMAVLFGFPQFEPISKSIVNMEMNMESVVDINEKNQEPKIGIFGGWFVLLDK